MTWQPPNDYLPTESLDLLSKGFSHLNWKLDLDQIWAPDTPIQVEASLIIHINRIILRQIVCLP